MLSIGEFASIGRVSVRMLRHYDAIGLLHPAVVDQATGYRSYTPAQIIALNRIVEFKELGLTLDQVRRIVDGEVGTQQLEVMLTTVRAELQRSLIEDAARLDRIDARLRTVRGESVMAQTSSISVDVRSVEPQRVATLTRRAPGYGSENVGPVIGPMYPETERMLDAAGITGYGPAVALYEADESGDGEGMFVIAGFVVPEDTREVPGLDVHEIAAVDLAAVTVHRGEVDGIDDSWMALTDWITQNGYELAGVCREVYWTPGDRPQSEWVTDLVQPVRAVA
ncbi:MerR family transcriptional regulator [Humibacter ginsenosidimutans]|uniref:MerR family transcriptional regulator n=1 Tax=Humibacter ginsenosidimutans TaxID=2599293 RepID=A0A5B8M4G8_9MICO|nr:MerR family transcriptional regulator [Humibacter ginsenosidimutans]QDZ15111.1 MerR family transcriptional regulator [Humibacter ginsenosidimutans]